MDHLLDTESKSVRSSATRRTARSSRKSALSSEIATRIVRRSSSGIATMNPNKVGHRRQVTRGALGKTGARPTRSNRPWLLRELTRRTGQ